ncbi:MAG: hydrogenase maturation protease [Casimicrobiaceae bacterium]
MLTIIGCGNTNRSDDGVGVFVAQALARGLAASPRRDVQVFDAGTGGVDVMFKARGSDELVIVDACRSGSDPGSVFEVPGEELEASYTPAYSLHDFRWDHAIAAGRKIFAGEFPSRVHVYLIEAQDLGLGLTLSAPVRASAERVIIRLRERIDAYTA